MRELVGHNKDVRAVTFTPDGRRVSGGSDKKVRVWDPLTGKALHTLKAPSVVYAVAISPDGKTLAYAGRHGQPLAEENTVQRWDLPGGSQGKSLLWRMGPYAG